jgi:hypothetical protein
LTIATGDPPSSPELNGLPARTGIPVAAKKSDVTSFVSLLMSSPFDAA